MPPPHKKTLYNNEIMFYEYVGHHVKKIILLLKNPDFFWLILEICLLNISIILRKRPRGANKLYNKYKK